MKMFDEAAVSRPFIRPSRRLWHRRCGPAQLIYGAPKALNYLLLNK